MYESPVHAHQILGLRNSKLAAERMIDVDGITLVDDAIDFPYWRRLLGKLRPIEKQRLPFFRLEHLHRCFELPLAQGATVYRYPFAPSRPFSNPCSANITACTAEIIRGPSGTPIGCAPLAQCFNADSAELPLHDPVKACIRRPNAGPCEEKAQLIDGVVFASPRLGSNTWSHSSEHNLKPGIHNKEALKAANLPPGTIYEVENGFEEIGRESESAQGEMRRTHSKNGGGEQSARFGTDGPTSSDREAGLQRVFRSLFLAAKEYLEAPRPYPANCGEVEGEARWRVVGSRRVGIRSMSMGSVWRATNKGVSDNSDEHAPLRATRELEEEWSASKYEREWWSSQGKKGEEDDGVENRKL
ncbi:hypothetical protein C8R44DRAFT_913348 [Mycena epipterygia]|nr:hypothetical protein C8R44DRAFT_913348 [Mycena epipterygia]